MTFAEVHVKRSVILTDRLGPDILRIWKCRVAHYFKTNEQPDKDASKPVARHFNLHNHSKQHMTICHVTTNSVAPPPLYKLHTTHNSLIRSDEGLALETSAFRIPVRWSVYIINSIKWRLILAVMNAIKCNCVKKPEKKNSGLQRIFFRLLYAIAFNCVHNCEDQPSLDFISAVHMINFIYITYIINSVDKTKLLYTTPPPTQHHSFFRNYSLYLISLKSTWKRWF